MNRRKFIYTSGITTGAIVLSGTALACAVKPDPLARLGLTTVVFRNRFHSTATIKPLDELKLEDIPSFFKGRFGIANLEFWSKHFESLEPSYLNNLRKIIADNGCRLINIQVDSTGYDISDTEETIRQKGIDEMKAWIDAAVILGVKKLRVTIMRKSLEQAIASVKILLDYAEGKDITLLVENHNDLFSIPENHIQIAKAFESRKLGLIADLGNYREPVDRFEAIKKICPFTHLVSAKLAVFDENYQHMSFDFDKCIRTMKECGYNGIYSIEQYATGNTDYDYERIVEYAIERILANLS